MTSVGVDFLHQPSRRSAGRSQSGEVAAAGWSSTSAAYMAVMRWYHARSWYTCWSLLPGSAFFDMHAS